MIEPTFERNFESLTDLALLTAGHSDDLIFQTIFDLYNARKDEDDLTADILLGEIESLMPQRGYCEVDPSERVDCGFFGVTETECTESHDLINKIFMFKSHLLSLLPTVYFHSFLLKFIIFFS